MLILATIYKKKQLNFHCKCGYGQPESIKKIILVSLAIAFYYSQEN
jgi:hypothetical protein